ncbi:aldo/keto reductase [Umbelopsis sp. PMI_123]|nr:aldo/keto reductase [Umbelopsis sp. PMI_123]
MSLPLSSPLREIGKTGVKISAIGYGGMSLAPGIYGETDDEVSVNLLKKALDIGCNFWDTADVYGQGHSEKVISRVLKDRRKDVFLATKFGNDYSSGTFRVNGSPEYLKKCCDASLERLQTDYIDLFYSHRIDPDTPIEVTVGAMAELVKEGKVKYLGLSECSAITLRRAHKVHPITAVQVEYSPWTLDHEQNDLIKTARELGVSIVAYSPLGRGFLSGQIKSLDDLDKDDRRRIMPRFQGENFAKNFELADKIKEIAHKRGVTASQLTLAWVLAQGDDIFVIPGTRKEKYLQENVSAGAIVLSKEELAEVRNIAESFDVSGERYHPEMMKHLGN